MFVKKAPKFQLDADKADSALQSILTTCNQTPSSLPINQIILRQKMNTRPYNRLLIVAFLLFLLQFCVPFIIVPAAKYTSQYFTVSPVIMTGYEQEGDYLYLTFQGDYIQFSEAYMETADEIRYPATSFDKKSKTICFPFLQGEEINFYIPVMNGKTVQLLLFYKE